MFDSSELEKLNYVNLFRTNPDLVKKLVKSLLNQGLVRVHFKKINGEFRDMLCTTNESLILQTPVVEDKVPKMIRKENEDVCKVYDVAKKEWRSFRWDNLLDIIENSSDKIYLTENIATTITDKG